MYISVCGCVWGASQCHLADFRAFSQSSKAAGLLLSPFRGLHSFGPVCFTGESCGSSRRCLPGKADYCACDLSCMLGFNIVLVFFSLPAWFFVSFVFSPVGLRLIVAFFSFSNLHASAARPSDSVHRSAQLKHTSPFIQASPGH